MRVLVVATATSPGGGLTLLRDLARFVGKNTDGKHHWIFLLAAPYIEECDNITVRLLPQAKSSRLARLAFDWGMGARLINRMDADVLLSLQNTPVRGVSCQQVVYLHQPIPFQSIMDFSLFRRSERTLAVYQHVIGPIICSSLPRADQVVVQTEWMKASVLQRTSVSSSSVRIVAPDVEVEPRSFEPRTVTDVTEFFYPTSAVLYKNYELLLAATKLLNGRGVTGWHASLTLNNPAPPRNVTMLGQIPRGDVLARLDRSVLVYPSLIESFGLPLAEARALGSLILAADLPYAREVLDGYANAYFFDPTDAVELARLMERVVNGQIRCVETSELARFSQAPRGWDEIVRVLEEVVDHDS